MGNIQEIEFIKTKVAELRQKQNITPGKPPRGECSCFSLGVDGELKNLMMQLAYTRDGDGDWSSLKDNEIRGILTKFVKGS